MRMYLIAIVMIIWIGTFPFVLNEGKRVAVKAITPESNYLLETAMINLEEGIRDSGKKEVVAGCLGRAFNALKLISAIHTKESYEYLKKLLSDKEYRTLHGRILEALATKFNGFY
jgi:hypothetical protein